jgi:hypothetical protein
VLISIELSVVQVTSHVHTISEESPATLSTCYGDCPEFGKARFLYRNPAWKEITDSLLPGQRASDRPDITCRVFNLKLKELMDDLTKKNVLGVAIAHVKVIEFQKRGLPHAHIVLIVDDDDKPRNPDDYDRFVSAEIPSEDNPVLRKGC